MKPTYDTLQFLEGGGEMGRRIREKDWSKTPVGNPEHWPQSLRTSLSIIINSKFPMFLFWGNELICFYNDAYRPSLGNDGKHPNILGGRAEEYWSEIWHIIKPLIDQVLAGGEATWSEDQLIPIYRNGKIEDVYWTFSYSPVRDESGKPAGVFITCSETTEKVRVQKKLEESEQKLRLIILQAPVSIGVFRGDNYVTEIANSRALELWGRREEEVLHRPILEALPELQSQGIKILLDDVYTTGNKFSATEFPIELLRANKLERAYINFSYSPLYNFDGKIDGVMAVGIEVTPQVVINKKIKANEEKLGIVIDASELGTWELNIVTGEVYYSDRYTEILGEKTGTILTHQEILKYFYPEDLPIREKAFKHAIANGVLHYECRIIWSDGSIHWIESKGKVFYDERNQPLNLIGTVRDITDEKNYKKKLEESERKFRLLADSIPQHIWTADIEGNLNYFNQSVLDYSGQTAEQLKTNGWIEIVHPDDRAENIKLWIESITTGKDFAFEHRFRKHDGVYRWQLSRAVPQKDDSGKINMWVGTSTDIEEQKVFAQELEREVQRRTLELARNNEELEKMNRELKSFTYISSHDLQEPLRKIQTFSSILLDKEFNNLSENGKSQFKRMQSSAERMQTLIADLLAYSRTNTTDRVFENIELSKIVEEVEEDLQEELQQKHARIEMEHSVQIRIIQFQFRQLLHNLITNSLKFSTQEKSPVIKISCDIQKGNQQNNALDPKRDYYHITISDNGIGFEQEYSEKIFELFQRLHSKADYVGTGIGLAIVKKIVENHSGFIRATSALGEGTKFDIYIPTIE